MGRERLWDVANENFVIKVLNSIKNNVVVKQVIAICGDCDKICQLSQHLLDVDFDVPVLLLSFVPPLEFVIFI